MTALVHTSLCRIILCHSVKIKEFILRTAHNKVCALYSENVLGYLESNIVDFKNHINVCFKQHGTKYLYIHIYFIFEKRGKSLSVPPKVSNSYQNDQDEKNSTTSQKEKCIVDTGVKSPANSLGTLTIVYNRRTLTLPDTECRSGLGY